MANPIEWKEADRTETKTIPGASARLVVRRRYAPRGIIEMTDATPADLASALGALPAVERAQVLQAFGSDPEICAALLADCAVAHGRAAVSEAVANETRKERVAAEAERDEARRHLCNERNGAAGLRDALATMRKERDTARDQCAQVAAERDALRTELRAREWLDEQEVRVIGNPRLVLVGVPGGVLFAYASYAGAARALGWEG